jgi:hypothetical protein
VLGHPAVDFAKVGDGFPGELVGVEVAVSSGFRRRRGAGKSAGILDGPERAPPAEVGVEEWRVFRSGGME